MHTVLFESDGLELCFLNLAPRRIPTRLALFLEAGAAFDGLLRIRHGIKHRLQIAHLLRRQCRRDSLRPQRPLGLRDGGGRPEQKLFDQLIEHLLSRFIIAELIYKPGTHGLFSGKALARQQIATQRPIAYRAYEESEQRIRRETEPNLGNCEGSAAARYDDIAAACQRQRAANTGALYDGDRRLR